MFQNLLMGYKNLFYPFHNNPRSLPMNTRNGFENIFSDIPNIIRKIEVIHAKIALTDEVEIISKKRVITFETSTKVGASRRYIGLISTYYYFIFSDN